MSASRNSLGRCLVVAAFSTLAGPPMADAAPRPIPGPQGAVKVAFTMPTDGQATVALYTPSGRLVRILGQLLELTKGDYEVRWDGMDLWGHPVPAGTKLVAKVFTNPGLRAFYEFTVGHPGNPPWLTRPMGAGPAMRTGGWLGDHTPPSAALAFGDRVFLGCRVAEHGHALIATNLRGEKMWGINGLEGWQGPWVLCTNGKAIFGPAGRRGDVYRINPETYEYRTLCNTGADSVRAMAARGGRLYLVLNNHRATRSPFAASVDGGSFDYDRCVPAPSSAGRNHPRQLSPREMFATTFYRGGHFQTGVRPTVRGDRARALAVLASPKPIGTVVLERPGGVKHAEVYVLKPGTAYDATKHLPKVGAPPSSDWLALGRTEFPRRLAFVTAPRAGLTSHAVYVRLRLESPTAARRGVTLGMCRILERRVASPPTGLTVHPPTDAKPAQQPKRAAPIGKLGWRFRMPRSINELAPANVVLKLDSAQTIHGVCLLDCGTGVLAVDAFTGPADADPADAGEDAWREVTTNQAARGGRRGWASASPHHNERYIPLPTACTTRAIRIRLLGGFGGGRVDMGSAPDDPTFARCSEVALLRLIDPLVPPPSHILQVRDTKTGQILNEVRGSKLDIAAMAFDRDGTLLCAVGTALCRSDVTDRGLRHTVLNDTVLREPVSIAVGGGQIAVGDNERSAVLLFDTKGKLLRTLGDRGRRKRGRWDPKVVERPYGVAIDRSGSVWVTEASYSPKRVVRFGPDGEVEAEMFGPAEYGGGGFLDPDLKRFYYRSIQFALDWKAGTSRVVALNDRPNTPETPALEGSTFVYTKVGRPIHYRGRRYIVGDPGGQGHPGIAVCILAGDVWRPCAVMGSAAGSAFLLRKEHWRKHWLEKDLHGKSFIWCDHNGDGHYQTDEVELFADTAYGGKGKPFSYPGWGAWLGADLTFWGRSARLAPTRFTNRGVPVYEAKRLEPFDYSRLAPIYRASFTTGRGGSANAKPNYGAASIVTHDGSLLLEGQPYRVGPDGKIVGGPAPTESSDYVPPIHGQIMDQPLHFVGSAVTDSPVGEVALMNGNNGHWFVVGARDCVLLGRIFTGREGGWGTDLPARRGIEVTHRRHAWECFFGHFIKAHNAKYYVVAGHGFHAISRVEGLDDYRVQVTPLTVTPSDVAANAKLRPRLVALTKAARAASSAPKSRTFLPIAKRTVDFALDGHVADWGDSVRMATIGNGDAAPRFDGAYDGKGLVLAYRGHSALGNNSQDPRFLFKTGFCFEMEFRSAARNRSRQVVAGDRRIVFGNHRGKWVAVLYDYIDPSVSNDKHVPFSSPWVTTTVARVALLPAKAAQVRFRQLSQPDASGAAEWSAEVKLTWSALGFEGPPGVSWFDFGVRSADSGGIRVAKRSYWSNPGPTPVADLGVEAMITPGAWGTVRFGE